MREQVLHQNKKREINLSTTKKGYVLKKLTIINEVNNKFYSSLNEKEFNSFVTSIENIDVPESTHNIYSIEEYTREVTSCISPIGLIKGIEIPEDEIYNFVSQYVESKVVCTVSNIVSYREELSIDLPEDMTPEEFEEKQPFLTDGAPFQNTTDMLDDEFDEDNYEYQYSSQLKVTVPKIDYYGFRFFDNNTTPQKVRG